MSTNYAQILERAANAAFVKNLKVYEDPFISEAVMVVQSQLPSELYPYLGEPAVPQDVTDGKPFENKELAEYSMTVTNRTFKSAMRVKESELEDDQTGGLEIRMKQLVENAINYQKVKLIEQLIGTTTAYDGATLFSARTGLGDNDLTHSGSPLDPTEVSEAIDESIVAHSSFLGHNGQPFIEAVGFSKFAIVAPFAMRRSIMTALNAEDISGTSNVAFNGISFMPYFSPRLSGAAGTFYLLNISSPLKTLLLQQRVAPRATVVGADSEQALKSDHLSVVTRQRFQTATPIWQTATKMVCS